LLKEAALEAKKKFQAAKAKYDAFPSELHFINFPIPDEYFVADDLVEALCREIEARIREGKVRMPASVCCLVWPLLCLPPTHTPVQAHPRPLSGLFLCFHAFALPFSVSLMPHPCPIAELLRVFQTRPRSLCRCRWLRPWPTVRHGLRAGGAALCTLVSSLAAVASLPVASLLHSAVVSLPPHPPTHPPTHTLTHPLTYPPTTLS
jgi:hypothetical protein